MTDSKDQWSYTILLTLICTCTTSITVCRAVGPVFHFADAALSGHRDNSYRVVSASHPRDMYINVHSGSRYHYKAKSAPLAPNFSSVLINGLGRFPEGVRASAQSNSPHTKRAIYLQPSSALSVVGVTQGLRYRFRIVSMACVCYLIFFFSSVGLELDSRNLPLLLASTTTR